MSRHYLSELGVTATLCLTALMGVLGGPQTLVAVVPLAPAPDTATVDADLGAIAVAIQRGVLSAVVAWRHARARPHRCHVVGTWPLGLCQVRAPYQRSLP